MKKFESLYLSQDQWEELRNSITRKKTIPPTRKLFSAKRIKKALKAIRLSQQRLVELKSFNALLRKHELKQKSYSRETIARLLNNSEKISDSDFIEWITIFLSFFYTDDLCIFINPEEAPENEDPEDFNVWFDLYCRDWEARKEKLQNYNIKTKIFKNQNSIIYRKKAIVGLWKGDAHQEFTDDIIIPAKIEGELKMQNGDMIRGELNYFYENNEEQIIDAITLYGQFLYGSFLRLNYENRDDFIKQFGAAILHLDPTGSCLDGKFIGFGSRSNRLISADVRLKKVFTDKF